MKPFRRRFRRNKFCKLCTNGKPDSEKMDYKNPAILSNFMTERGKIIPRRISGNCATCQRMVTKSIKRARQVGLVPFTYIGG